MSKSKSSASSMGVMYSIYGIQLGPNFVLWLAADKNLYLRLTVAKIHAFLVLNKKYLQPYGCSNINFTAAVKCTNSKTEIKVK